MALLEGRRAAHRDLAETDRRDIRPCLARLPALKYTGKKH
jgi:hypothetical protein